MKIKEGGFIRTVLLASGLQNLWQAGGIIFPLNILSSSYFVLTGRYKLKTMLDSLFGLYILAGILSLLLNIMPLVLMGPDALLNALKSFFVFLSALVFFSGYRFSPKQFLTSVLLVAIPVGLGILIHIGYLFKTSDLTLYLIRGQISWAIGWPQRWVIFALMGYFYAFAFVRNGLWSKGLALMFLSLVLISGTRSALVGLMAGHLFMVRRGNILPMVAVIATAVLLYFYIPGFSDLLRMEETHAFIEEGKREIGGESSIGYRLIELWPAILRSLTGYRIFFGWGHVGISWLPDSFYAGTIIPQGEASAESQFMDVLQRQGGIGLFLFLSIIIFGIVGAFKLKNASTDPFERNFWLGSVGWQVAAVFQGITVETVRFPLFCLCYFIFLGMVSHYQGLALVADKN